MPGFGLEALGLSMGVVTIVELDLPARGSYGPISQGRAPSLIFESHIRLEMNIMHIESFFGGQEPLTNQPRGTAQNTGKPRNGMIVTDGVGGHLTLDLSSRELHWLAEACRQLAGESSPSWTTMLKVHCAGTVYLVMRHELANGDREIEITSMADPAERVRLSRDLAQLVASLIERSLDATQPSMAASA